MNSKNCNQDECNNPRWAKGFCKYHQNLRTDKKKPKKMSGKRKPTGERDLFLALWAVRPHYCENCGDHLGDEPKVHYFAHKKSKGANPELRLEPSNIMLLCMDCHDAYDFRGEEKYKSRSNLRDQ